MCASTTLSTRSPARQAASFRSWWLACVAATALGACRFSPETSVREDTASTASVSAWRAAGAQLAQRDEAQAHLDSARSFFLADVGALAAVELGEAAAITRSHAAAAAEPARSALLESAGDLGALATRVADDGLSAVPEMDSAFARLHLAEAQYHALFARAAWRLREPGVAAAELLMLADHLERAARDLRAPLAPAVRRNIVRTRSVAAMLSQTGMRRSREVEATLDAVDADIKSIRSRSAAFPN